EASPYRARASRPARQLLLSCRATPPLRGGECTPLICHRNSEPRYLATALIQRFDLDDRGTVIVTDPERSGILRIVDIHAQDVGRTRQHVFGVLSVSGVEPRDPVCQHGSGPCITIAIQQGGVWRASRRGGRQCCDLSGFR